MIFYNAILRNPTFAKWYILTKKFQYKFESDLDVKKKGGVDLSRYLL